nr:putative reverse transcriptase domain-containing protein [Tanacetum cinerariifolium]
MVKISPDKSQERRHPKTSFRMQYIHYELLVIPFGLTNALAILMDLMNKICRIYLDKFVIVFIDDILIYSRSKDEHKQHLDIILRFLKDEKCLAKIEAIKKWGKITMDLVTKLPWSSRGHDTCNTPKLGRSGIWDRGVLLHRSITQDIYRTTKKSFKTDTLDLTKVLANKSKGNCQLGLGAQSHGVVGVRCGNCLGFRIVLHLTKRLSGILWKVQEGLRNPWKIMEALRNSKSFHQWKVVEYGPSWSFETKCHTEDPCRNKSVISGIRASRFKAMVNEAKKNDASGSAVVDENRGRDNALQHPKKRGDVALCKRSLASGGGNTNHGPKLDVPKPSSFMGKRESRTVNDFLWEMEQYLEGVNVVDDASKIKLATRYLKDTAILYTRRDSSKPKDQKVNHEKGREKGMPNRRARDCRKKEKIEVLKVIGKDLQYVGATINSVKVCALVFWSTHNFVAVDETKRLRINTTKVSGTIKSFANFLCILDGGKTCMVSKDQDDKSKAKTLLAMKLKKGFNKNEPCYLAVTRLETKVEVSNVIERVLDEFKDVIPKELLKKLPPRREVDHTIELETGSMPPSPRQSSLPNATNREELRKQLKELMDAGSIRPSKASYDLFDQLGKARHFTKLDLRSVYYQVLIVEGDEAKTTYVMRKVLFRPRGSQVLGIQDQGRRINNGRCKDKGYPRLGTTNQGYGVEIFPWLGESIPKVHHEMLGDSIPFDGPIEKEPSLDMGRRVTSGVQEFEEGGYEGDGVETTECDHAFQVTYGWIIVYYWRSSNARRRPDRIREPDVKRDRKEVHGARERDNSGSPLLEDLETLFVRFKIRDQDGTFIAAPPDAMADDTTKIFFKNVVRDGFELLHEFSSLNRQENGEDECTIGAL